jgi:hypothetical protein
MALALTYCMDDVRDLMPEYMPPVAPDPVRVPSVWRAMGALEEAWRMIEANPDLCGEDLELALESEAPDAVRLLDALVGSYQHSRYTADKDAAYAKMVAARAKRSKEIVEERKALTIAVMQKLRIKTHRAPAGTATWSTENGPTLITDKTLIPAEYLHPPKDREPDVVKIRKALDNNIPVDGATLGNGGYSLTVK